jgi:hypothetical protein
MTEQQPAQPKRPKVVRDGNLHAEVVNLATYETYVLPPPYELAVHVDYANAYAGADQTARVELHQTSDPAVAEAGTAFLAAVGGISPESDGTVVFNLCFPYDTTDTSFTPRIVREDNPSLQTIGLAREHICIISGGM